MQLKVALEGIVAFYYRVQHRGYLQQMRWTA